MDVQVSANQLVLVSKEPYTSYSDKITLHVPIHRDNHGTDENEDQRQNGVVELATFHLTIQLQSTKEEIHSHLHVGNSLRWITDGGNIGTAQITDTVIPCPPNPLQFVLQFWHQTDSYDRNSTLAKYPLIVDYLFLRAPNGNQVDMIRDTEFRQPSIERFDPDSIETVEALQHDGVQGLVVRVDKLLQQEFGGQVGRFELVVGVKVVFPEDGNQQQSKIQTLEFVGDAGLYKDNFAKIGTMFELKAPQAEADAVALVDATINNNNQQQQDHQHNQWRATQNAEERSSGAVGQFLWWWVLLCFVVPLLVF
eukprot:TRINITY_DN66724_c5_g2_i2.p1 TRINITY_DN66724_c5_g2~~TRINITY_DN66724_c5_g2_i2.p1  ORF type:complete len:332 (-),score=41.71 TRINITY_DN66724_c5_g2_i2:302-1228(-)